MFNERLFRLFFIFSEDEKEFFMKKCKFGFAAIVTALVFAVCLFAGCNHGSSSKGSTGSSMDGTYVSSDGTIKLIISGASCTYIASAFGQSVPLSGTIDKNSKTITLEGSGPVPYTFAGNTINFAGVLLIKQ